MKTAHYILLACALLIGGCSSSLRQEGSSARLGYDFSGIEKVAIVSVEGTIVSETARDQIAEFFAIELLEHGYAPIGRPQVRRLLALRAAEVNEAAVMDLSNPEEAVEIGLALKAPAVLTINVPHFGEAISITATMIDVEDGSILWIAHSSGRGATGESGFFGMGGGGAQQDDLLSGPSARPAGSTSGLPLSPDEAKQVQSIIKDVCRSLPTKAAEKW
ncbi:MAG: hypothetical protein JXM79_24315 [Sedimentisphaerales bacterium]|nr:hypothetical protein [Sedimentisphaerales bacterium]